MTADEYACNKQLCGWQNLSCGCFPCNLIDDEDVDKSHFLKLLVFSNKNSLKHLWIQESPCSGWTQHSFNTIAG